MGEPSLHCNLELLDTGGGGAVPLLPLPQPHLHLNPGQSHICTSALPTQPEGRSQKQD